MKGFALSGLWGNVDKATLQQISVQVLYQIARREELLSFHLHFHAIILYYDATSTCRLAHYFYAICLHQFTNLNTYSETKKYPPICVFRCKTAFLKSKFKDDPVRVQRHTVPHFNGHSAPLLFLT